MNSVNAVLGGNGVLNAFIGSSQMILLGAVSVLFSIAIALIPFLASRIVRGEVGNTMSALISAASLYAGAATKSFIGSSSSQPAAAGPPSAMTEPGPPTGGGPGLSGTVSAPNGSGGGGVLAESKPPTPSSPDSATSLGGPAGELGAGGAVLVI